MSNNSKGTDRKSYTIYRDVVFVNVVIFPCLNTLFQKKKDHFRVFSSPSSDRVVWSSISRVEDEKQKKKKTKEWVSR